MLFLCFFRAWLSVSLLLIFDMHSLDLGFQVEERRLRFELSIFG